MPATGNNFIHYNLSIRILADGFSFFVTEASTGDLMHCEDHTPTEGMTLAQTLGVMLQRPSIQRNTYDNVRVVVDSDSTCIPMDEFRREELTALYRQVFDSVDLINNKVYYTLLPQIDVVEAFTLPDAVLTAVTCAYPDATFTSLYASAMEQMAKFCSQRKPELQPLLTYVLPGQLFIISIHHDQLLYANSFQFDDQQNAIYFLLSVWKELGLNARENTCFLAGEQEAVKALAEQLRDYLLKIEMIEVKVPN